MYKRNIDLSNARLAAFDTQMIVELYIYNPTQNTMLQSNLDEQSTEDIKLNNNKLTNTNGFLSYKFLVILDLSFNNISSLFQLPPSLRILNLSNNRLSRVFQEYSLSLKMKGTRYEVKPMFCNLINLIEINLANNLIQVISSSCFDGNTRLQKIILSGNLLKGKLYCFRALVNIQHIDISKNRIEEWSDLKPFEKMLLLSLNIERNPLETSIKSIEEQQKQAMRLLPNVNEIITSFGIIDKNNNKPNINRISTTPNRISTTPNRISITPNNTSHVQYSPFTMNPEDKKLFQDLLPKKTITPYPSKTTKSSNSQKSIIQDKIVTNFAQVQKLQYKTPDQKHKRTNSNNVGLRIQTHQNTQTHKQIPNAQEQQNKLITQRNQVLPLLNHQCSAFFIQDVSITPTKILNCSVIDLDNLDSETLSEQIRQYQDQVEQIKSLNSTLIQNKQNLSQQEREFNKLKQYIQLLKEMLKQFYLFGDQSKINGFTEELNRIQKAKPHSMIDNKIRLLKFNQKYDTTHEIITNLKKQ